MPKHQRSAVLHLSEWGEKGREKEKKKTKDVFIVDAISTVRSKMNAFSVISKSDCQP